MAPANLNERAALGSLGGPNHEKGEMENGTIIVAISWGVGQIQPDEDGELIVFTMRVFNEDWSQAYIGRRVDFERYVNSADTRRVIGR